jgi:DNA helicase II / ATP-dependent DNA helicase PcrA
VVNIEGLWGKRQFFPNPAQRDAILHATGPLYLPAGPGSGKTRVLLWRTVNLIVNHDVRPREIFLSTFTEKAATQLREGLRELLGEVSNLTRQPYDLGEMYVGTVHSLCQRIAADRNFSPNRARSQAPVLLDALSQYFHVTDAERWAALVAASGFEAPDGDTEALMTQLNLALGNANTASRHKAAGAAIALFNRLSEECLTPDALLASETDPERQSLFKMYAVYLQSLRGDRARKVDFSLLQQDALAILNANPDSGSVFKHVIVDEYQDTNTVQERIFFALAAGHKNLCVVGDDDQALYRFRGATVENFVDFPNRVERAFGVQPRAIPLVRNYRSRRAIVDAYTAFIGDCDWSHVRTPGRHYRVAGKRIEAHSVDVGPSVVATTPSAPEQAADEVARLVRTLIDTGKVEDANQIAFLFPSLKSKSVDHMRTALEQQGLRIYAPRAGKFIEVDEASDMLGLMLRILGRPPGGLNRGKDMQEFADWQDAALARADALIDADPALARFVADRQAEIARITGDYAALSAAAEEAGLSLDQAPPFLQVRGPLLQATGLSAETRRVLGATQLQRVVERRARAGEPYTLRAILTRVTSLDWHVLDLFYRLCGFKHFIGMFDLAETGDAAGVRDEGPICNLALLSKYLARFLEERGGQLITAASLASHGFQRLFFSSYLFALFRLGESEYEDKEDPFPRGRIPFLTVHQSKGLEFPVVVLGNLAKRDMGASFVERTVHAHLPPSDAREPLDRMAGFDIMRMFYVALSRAQNLLVLANYQGRGQQTHRVFKTLCGNAMPRIPAFQAASVPAARAKHEDNPRNYSYTGDYMFYSTCPRRYMVFRRYGFASSTTQTMMFGSLVHRTIEDLHQMLIAQRLHDGAAQQEAAPV